MNPEHVRTRAAWEAIAIGYDRTHAVADVGGERRAAPCRIAPRDAVPRCCGGQWRPEHPAARLGARVLATDISPAMLERLGMRAREEGLGVQTAVMDGHALELDDDSFDLAGSQFGVMLFPDMPRGIASWRASQPGGRVLINAYGDPHQVEFLGFLVAAIQAVVPSFTGPPMDPIPLPFQLHDPERLGQELTAAGLKQVNVETVIEPTTFTSGEHCGTGWCTATRSSARSSPRST